MKFFKFKIIRKRKYRTNKDSITFSWLMCEWSLRKDTGLGTRKWVPPSPKKNKCISPRWPDTQSRTNITQHHVSHCLGSNAFSLSHELLKKSHLHSKPTLPFSKSTTQVIVLFAIKINRITSSLPKNHSKLHTARKVKWDRDSQPALEFSVSCKVECCVNVGQTPPPLCPKQMPLITHRYLLCL